MNEKEIRNLGGIELRLAEDDKESRKVEGYAVVFNTLSEDLGGFREMISPDAFDGVLENSDVFALMNHDNDKVLARSRYGVGNLTLTLDDKGLRYEFDAPNTDTGNELLEFLRNGIITQSSFAFTVAEDIWEKQNDGSYIRTIKKINKLYDVSPVYTPAYSATEVHCKRYAEILEAEKAEAEQRMAEAEAKRNQELADYFAKIRTQYLA